MKVIPHDFHNRRSVHQTLRDRANLAARQIPTLSVTESHRLALRTEYTGGIVIGLVFGFFVGSVFALWLNVGGCQ